MHAAHAAPPSEFFHRAWAQAWGALARSGDDGTDVRDRLLAAYDEPHRRYHTRQHLGECLRAACDWRALADRPAEVALALWFHDAVYRPRGVDNEALSAQQARAALAAGGVDPDAAQRIASHVLATRHAATPGADRDEALVVDIDLSILGADSARFDAYDAQVRAEYRWVPGPLFRRRRREVLEGFLARPSIFATPAIRDALESRARANLARSIARLR